MILLICYIPFCIGLAWLNYYLIEVKNKRIYHAINGALHLLTAAAGWYFFSWEVGVSVLLVARVVFDISLNLLRGLPISYVPRSPKSIVDILEKKLFRNNGIIPKLLYLSIVVLLNVLK